MPTVKIPAVIRSSMTAFRCCDTSVSVGGASALNVVLCAVPVAAAHVNSGGASNWLPLELILGKSIGIACAACYVTFKAVRE